MYIICNAYNNYDNSVFTAKICIFVNKIGTKPNCIFQKESILFIGLINYKNMKLAKKYWWLFFVSGCNTNSHEYLYDTTKVFYIRRQ